MDWTLGATYSDGPLYVGYAYLDEKDFGLTGAGSDLKVHKIGAKYAFASGTSVSALFDSAKSDGGVAAANELKRNAWMLGVNQSFGVQNVWLQYAKANELSGNAVASTSGTDAKQITLGWSYTMSKRTMLHAYYTKITNNNNTAGVSYDLAVNPVGLAGAQLGSGSDPTSLGFGLRHAF